MNATCSAVAGGGMHRRRRWSPAPTRSHARAAAGVLTRSEHVRRLGHAACSRTARCPGRRRSRRRACVIAAPTHSRAASSVSVEASSPSRMRALRSRSTAVRPGYALYQTCVGTWWRRKYSLNFRSSLQPPRIEPARPRIADAVAEHDVEPEADLVDEVVHVALEAAVVVAQEHHALATVEKHPAREMDRAHAGQTAARVQMSRRVVDREEDHDRRPEPDAGPASGCPSRELVADVVILDRGESSRTRGRCGNRAPDRSSPVFAAATAATAASTTENRRQQHRHQRHADKMQRVADAPPGRRGIFRGQRQPAGGDVLGDERPQPAVNSSRT